MADDSENPTMSKRAAKRAAKQELRDQEKRAKKEERAAEVAERERARVAAQEARFAAMSDAERSEVEALREEKRQRNAREKAGVDDAFRESCARGCRVAVDCDFESLMTEREVRSACQQLMYCYGANRRAAAPSRILLAGLRGKMAAHMQNLTGFSSWPATDAARRDVVYLTAESETVLEAVDPATTYVIGGFVDRNRHKGLTRDKAKRLGLRTARLPIGADMPITLGGASKVLTINHVFELLVSFQGSGDWAEAGKCLPGRKLAAGADAERPPDDPPAAGLRGYCAIC